MEGAHPSLMISLPIIMMMMMMMTMLIVAEYTYSADPTYGGGEGDEYLVSLLVVSHTA